MTIRQWLKEKLTPSPPSPNPTILDLLAAVEQDRLLLDHLYSQPTHQLPDGPKAHLLDNPFGDLQNELSELREILFRLP